LAFTYLRYHVIFSTKDRIRFLHGEVLLRTVDYISGIARRNGGTVHIGGGMPDHIHLLITIPSTRAIAEFIGRLKSLSSGWIHRTFPDLKLFSWQDGYAVFCVSPSVIKHVYRYIEQQERHHQDLDSRQELIRLLQKHDIHYDPEHV